MSTTTDISFPLLSAASVLILAIIGGILPLHLGRRNDTTGLLTLGNFFSAGVFLAAGMVHMLPDANAAWQGLNASGFPLPGLCAALGFLLVFFLERVAVDISEESLQKAALALDEDSEEDPETTPTDLSLVREQNQESSAAQTTTTARPTSAYLLLAVLSVHSFIAGLALGVARDPTAGVVLLVAIMSHKSLAAFALGVALVRSNASRSTVWKLVLAFSTATPLGICLGLLVATTADSVGVMWVQAIALGTGSGTFLYVAGVDIMVHDIEKFGDHDKSKGVKFAMMMIGFSAMAILALIV